MTGRSITAVVFLFVAAAAAQAKDDAAFAPPAAPRDPSVLGVGIQRTMTLLATSTPQQRNKVRILFYGQSITEQTWAKTVADDLRKRFPNADLEIENRAIGGHASQLLVRVAEHDVYPFYPDLLIFHVYGGNKEYEDIIAATRRRMTTEILMQKDHATQTSLEPPDMNRNKGAWWDNLMNTKLLPDIARKYGCALVDIRGDWMDYLNANNCQPKDLLRDGVHLNDRGNFLLAELIKRYLVHRPDLAASVPADLVKTYEVGKDIAWKDGTLTLEFEGNRVDAIAAPAAGTAAPQTAKVTVDGKRPSDFPEAYCITRPSVTQAGFWPAILRVSWEKPLLLEDWTARITESNDDGTQFRFEASGSKTGPDGSGSGAVKFVSSSGRVVIEPQDWRLKAGYDIGGKRKVPANFQIKWQVKPLFVDEYAPPKAGEPGREYATTLVQGIANAKHTLVLDGAVPVRAIRVYKPPLR
ncbi:MAG: SGNH/GDSL hydrolase family protein [Planctomycetota bacterium]|nr:SGNH/GDSL hydrolase family protein [Planctomycetota bacterium]